MSNCNIDGNQISYRRTSGYISLALVVMFIGSVFIFDLGIWKILVFFPAIVMSISLLEASNKTCIVYSSIGIKHMGQKYEKEKELVLNKYQRHLSKKKGFKVEVNVIKETIKRLQMKVQVDSERHGPNGFIAVIDKSTGKVIMTHSKTTHENPKYRENLRLKF